MEGVAYEVYDNGGINWDRSFGALLDQYLGIVRSGLPMPPASVARAEAAVASLKSHSWPGLVLWTGCFEGCWLLLVVLRPLARVLVGREPA